MIMIFIIIIVFIIIHIVYFISDSLKAKRNKLFFSRQNVRQTLGSLVTLVSIFANYFMREYS